MAKVLIIDKDIHTLNSLSMYLAAINIEAVIVHNWPSNIKGLALDELLAIFVDVELTTVHINKLFQTFHSDEGTKIPIFFMFSRTFAPLYVKAKEFPYTGDFKKPVQLTEVHTEVKKQLGFSEIPYKALDHSDTVTEYQSFLSEYTDWVQKFGSILNKQDVS